MKLGNTNAAILSLSFVTIVSCRHVFPSWSTKQHHHTTISHGWMASQIARSRSDSDIPSWFMSMRGGSVASSSAEPDTAAPVDGTIQSLYLPGLLDISIHRPSAVSISIINLLFIFYSGMCTNLFHERVSLGNNIDERLFCANIRSEGKRIRSYQR